MRLFTDPAAAWRARPKPHERFFRWCYTHDMLGATAYVAFIWLLIFAVTCLLKWWLA